jgi:hypothetical protein
MLAMCKTIKENIGSHVNEAKKIQWDRYVRGNYNNTKSEKKNEFNKFYSRSHHVHSVERKMQFCLHCIGKGKYTWNIIRVLVIPAEDKNTHINLFNKFP